MDRVPHLSLLPTMTRARPFAVCTLAFAPTVWETRTNAAPSALSAAASRPSRRSGVAAYTGQPQLPISADTAAGAGPPAGLTTTTAPPGIPVTWQRLVRGAVRGAFYATVPVKGIET